VLVGNPVREGFVSPPDRAEACKRFGLNPAIPVILVSGGSQGARTLNEAVEGALAAFDGDEVQVIWAAGRQDTARWKSAAANARAKVSFHEYIEDMPAACAAATLIVGRAGASTTAEIAAMGKPSVLVPYPYATDAHQDENARAFREAGAALVFADGEWSAAAMIETVRMLLDDPVQVAAMAAAAKELARLDSARDIVREIEAAISEQTTHAALD
jgi:UDP-N-acetylglucosamine--N-acetylmuramyl-(pentapeptide) pyrophosphoryl-undecaprenol N-acetylglucosamine transferase